MEMRPATISDFVWEFGLAETQNDERHDRMYSRGLGSDLFHRVRSNQRQALTEVDWERLRATIEATRPDYISSLWPLDLERKIGWLETGLVPELRVPFLEIFRPLAPSQILSDFVKSLEAGPPTARLAVEENFRSIRTAFDPSRMLGAPLVIGERATGPFTIVEGVTRLSVLCSRERHGEPTPPSVRLVLGVGSRASRWPFW